ncbi:MAG: hypothetical protein ACYCPO_13515 [Acidobacteriaceae bacterium]
MERIRSKDAMPFYIDYVHSPFMLFVHRAKSANTNQAGHADAGIPESAKRRKAARMVALDEWQHL